MVESVVEQLASFLVGARARDAFGVIDGIPHEGESRGTHDEHAGDTECSDNIHWQCADGEPERETDANDGEAHRDECPTDRLPLQLREVGSESQPGAQDEQGGNHG